MSYRKWAIYGNSLISLGFPENRRFAYPTNVATKRGAADLRRRRVDCPSSLPPWASWFGRSPVDQKGGEKPHLSRDPFQPGWCRMKSYPCSYIGIIIGQRYSQDRSLWNNLVLMEMETEKVNQKKNPKVWWWFIMAKSVRKTPETTNPWPPMMTGILGVAIYTPTELTFRMSAKEKGHQDALCPCFISFFYNSVGEKRCHNKTKPHQPAMMSFWQFLFRFRFEQNRTCISIVPCHICLVVCPGLSVVTHP